MRSRAAVSLLTLLLGCGRGTAIAQDRTITFAKDIAPLIFTHCAQCHHPGGDAPFSLLKYTDVRQRASLIAQVTASRFMPPWKPEPGYGRFEGARRLADDDVARIAEWVREGTKLGDPADLPKAPAFSAEWRLGEPDIVVRLPEAYELAADGPDVFRTFVVPLPTNSRRYVKGVEFRAGAPGVVHHASIKIDSTRSSRRLDEDDPAPGYNGGGGRTARFPDGQFLAWTPGQTPSMLPEGMAWQLDPGTDLVLELHLVPRGKPERVNPTVGLYLSNTPPSETPYILRLGSQTIDIPAGERRYALTDTFVLPVDADVIGLQPHAHNLAREIKVRARLPDGRTEWLLYISDWDFRWQEVYRYTDRVRLPKGTTLLMEYTYDNSTENPRNPNRPPVRVTFGQTTASEMGNVWIQVLPLTREDLGVLDRTFAPKLLRDDLAGYIKDVELNPTDARLRAELAFVYLSAGRTDAAIAQLQDSIRLSPDISATHFALGTVLLEQRDLKAAEQEFADALRLKPAFPEAHLNLGVLKQSEGRLGEAVAHYQEAVRLDPLNAAAHYNLGRGHAAQRHFLEAIGEYRMALQFRPDDADAWSSLGSALATIHRTDEAIETYRRALAVNPQAVGALIDLAWLLATAEPPSRRIPEDAVRLAERAAALTDHQNVIVLDALAAAYFAAGRTDLAIETENAALQLAVDGGDLEQMIRKHLGRFQLH
jgi:tetratricopeptide (TPR) repeat protein/mono/diheme cytochrome c family protein